MLETSKIVERILEDYEDARNSDKLLIYKVWEYQGFNLTETQKRFYFDKLLSSETITRTRRKLQEHGLYPATKAVKSARKVLENQIANEMSHTSHKLNNTPKAISWLNEDD